MSGFGDPLWHVFKRMQKNCFLNVNFLNVCFMHYITYKLSCLLYCLKHKSCNWSAETFIFLQFSMPKNDFILLFVLTSWSFSCVFYLIFSEFETYFNRSDGKAFFRNHIAFLHRNLSIGRLKNEHSQHMYKNIHSSISLSTPCALHYDL